MYTIVLATVRLCVLVSHWRPKMNLQLPMCTSGDSHHCLLTVKKVPPDMSIGSHPSAWAGHTCVLLRKREAGSRAIRWCGSPLFGGKGIHTLKICQGIIRPCTTCTIFPIIKHLTVRTAFVQPIRTQLKRDPVNDWCQRYVSKPRTKLSISGQLSRDFVNEDHQSSASDVQ